MNRKRRSIQKKRWEDNIKEWTGMDIASSARAADGDNLGITFHIYA